MNFTLPVSNGLLRPEHVKRMGDAVWLELLLEDMVTGGEGDDGIVWKGQPVCDRELAARLGVSEKTIARYRIALLPCYITAKRKSCGYAYTVLRSKKWMAIRQSRSDKSVLSDQTKVSDHEGGDRTQPAKRSDTTGRSNKETKSGHRREPSQPDKQRQADPRFQPIIDFYYQDTRRVGIEPGCDPSDFGCLKSWLKRNPERTIESVLTSLHNAIASTDHYPLRTGFRLREFLEHESKYQRGPLLKAGPKPVQPIAPAPRNELTPSGSRKVEAYGVVS